MNDREDIARYNEASHRITLCALALAIMVVLVVVFLRAAHGAQSVSQYNLQPRSPAGLRVAPGDASTYVVGGSPSSCPRRRFCGCVLSIEVFGHADPALFPAKAWFRFPRARAAPGMVAVRKHHVFKLIAHVQGREWSVLDPNSGGGLTRIHTRSIAGFVIVDPRGRA